MGLDTHKREEQKGVFGYHNNLENFMDKVKDAKRGLVMSTIANKTGLSRSTIQLITIQAEALGKIITETTGERKQHRIFYTPNKQLYYRIGDKNLPEIKNDIQEQLEELGPFNEEDEIRISIQKVEA